ncbi:MAG: DNA translocase FtsK, partial [Anaerolineae bacterium]
KNWTKPVGAPVVRDLYGVITAENANKGILITTSRFTDSARAFAEGKPLELIDGQMWSDLLAERPDADVTAEQEITPRAADVEEYGPLFKEAKRLVMGHSHASAAFLQRRLGIGYPRAARLIDQLEEAGIVGPMESGGRSRKVLVRDEKSPAEQDISRYKKRRSWWDRLVGR